jgi:hypothetical protein
MTSLATTTTTRLLMRHAGKRSPWTRRTRMADVSTRRWMGSPETRALSSVSVTPLSTQPDVELSVRQREYYTQGWIGSDGLTAFETLHEMQTRSCQVFAEKRLFGTYSDASKAYEWISFAEFDQAVSVCRAVLRDLGTLRCLVWGCVYMCLHVRVYTCMRIYICVRILLLELTVSQLYPSQSIQNYCQSIQKQ